LGKGKICKTVHVSLRNFSETGEKSETGGKCIIASEGMDPPVGHRVRHHLCKYSSKTWRYKYKKIRVKQLGIRPIGLHPTCTYTVLSTVCGNGDTKL